MVSERMIALRHAGKDVGFGLWVIQPSQQLDRLLTAPDRFSETSQLAVDDAEAGESGGFVFRFAMLSRKVQRFLVVAGGVLRDFHLPAQAGQVHQDLPQASKVF